MPITMPPAPNKDDLTATWRFLQIGVDKIMTNLKDGVDMVTVSDCPNFFQRVLLIRGCSTWASIRRSYQHCLDSVLANRNLGLFTTSVHHRKQ